MSLQITPKKFQLFIKAGHNVETLTAMLNITEEELNKALEKFAEGKALRDMHRKLKNNPGVKEFLPAQAQVVQDVSVEESVEEGLIENLETEIATSKPSLEDVLKRIENCNNRIFQVENLHKEYTDKRSQAKAILLNAKREVNEIQKRLSDLDKIIEDNMSLYRACGAKMKGLSEEKRELNEELKKLEELEIQLETVSIFVFKDGSIMADNTVVEVPEEAWRIIHKALYEEEEILDSLTGAQSKTLSKLFAYLKTLDKKYEIIFDVPEMNNAFELLKTKFI